MATKTIDILLNLHPDQAALVKAKGGVKSLEKALKDVEAQADKTRNKMQKLANVGRSLALVGGAIVAPFALAMKKYVEVAGQTEGTSRRLVALGKRWEESQVRIGRVTATIVLPALEKALDVVDKITKFAEENPGFVKAALGIGASLIILGGIVTTTASIISSIATIQGLLASAGVLTGAGAAAGGAGLAASISAGIAAAAPILAIVGAVVLAAELTRQLLNWATGTETTWKDIGVTVKQLGVIYKEGSKMMLTAFVKWGKELPVNIGRYIAEASQKIATWLQNLGTNVVGGISRTIQGLGAAIVSGLVKFAASISAAIKTIADKIASFFGKIPGKADGGHIGAGLFMGGEQGREFVMSNRTTKAAENIIGGTLTQQRLLESMAGNKRVTYNDSRRFDASVSSRDRRIIRNDMLTAFSAVIK